MRERLSDYQEEYEGELFNLEATPAESTAYRLAKHDRKRWPDIPYSRKRGRYSVLYKQLPPACRIYRQIFSMPWISRMSCRLFILQVRYSMHLSAKSFRTGRLLQHWYVRSQRITSCRIIPFLLLIPYAGNMAISAENILPVRNVERRQRSTVVLPDITVLYRTGTMARHRNIRTVLCMM